MENSEEKDPQVPESSRIIEPETMSETEIREAKQTSGRRSRRVFIKESPYGTQFTHIEVETFGPDSMGAGSPFIMPKPPTLATWICLILAWIFLSSRVLFSVLIGLPLNIVALVLALVCLTRGGIGTGIAVLLLGTGGSLFAYLVGLLRFLS